MSLPPMETQMVRAETLETFQSGIPQPQSADLQGVTALSPYPTPPSFSETELVFGSPPPSDLLLPHSGRLRVCNKVS